MKKLMTMAAVAAMAVSAQAVTIAWGSGGQINVVDGGVPTLMASSSLVGQTAMGLFYLGNTGGTVLTVDQLSVGDALVTSSAVGTKVGTNDSTFSTQTYTTAIAGISAGDVFAVFFINNENSTVSAWFTDATLTTAFNSTYTFTGSETDLSNGIGAFGNEGGTAAVYVPVPEPATAALALAGLAMLIRRRK